MPLSPSQRRSKTLSAPFQTTGDNIRIDLRGINAGEKLCQTGMVTVRGDIGAGACIDIDEGGICVEGNVGDGVMIRVRGTGKFARGIVIAGTTGNDVTLDCDLDVQLDKGAGDRLRVRGGNDVSLGQIGDNSNINIKGGVTGGNMGRNARIRCEGSCIIGQLGHGSTIEAGTFVQVTRAGHDCQIIAGDTVNLAALGADSTVRAVNDALVGVSHAFAKVAGSRTFINQTSRREEDFTLQDDKKWNAAATPRLVLKP